MQLPPYTCFIDAPPQALYEFLSAPESYRELQPFVIGVQDIVYGTDAEGRATRSSVTIERFQFLRVFHFDNPIRVQMTLTQPNEVLENAVQARAGTSLLFVTRFEPEGSGTRLSETVTLQASRLLKGYIVKQATFAQHARFMALKTRFENA